MNIMLINKFFSEDCTPPLRNELLVILKTMRKDKSIQRKELTYNRFNVYLNGETEEATIEEDFEIASIGKVCVSFQDLISIIERLDK